MVGSAAAEEARDETDESEEVLLERCMVSNEVEILCWWILGRLAAGGIGGKQVALVEIRRRPNDLGGKAGERAAGNFSLGG